MNLMNMCVRCKKRPAMVYINRVDGDKTSLEGYCIPCARELNIKPVSDMLDNMNIPSEDLEAMSEQMMSMMNGEQSDDDLDGAEAGGAQAFPFLQNIFGDMAKMAQPSDESDNNDGGTKQKKPKEKKNKYLSTYCTNLTDRARNGELDRIIGRDRELGRVVQILSRRTKNNPCLIGEPGVGKTAIAEGLALRIVSGEVPARLADKQIYLLDLTALVAGTQFRGQFESRVKGLIDEVKRAGNVILFIDEVHNMVGAGDTAEGSMNAANILKPALSRGEIQVIGATTFKEYRKYIEKDAALERRFQPVVIEEPSVDDTVTVLTGIKGYYETYHNVKVSDRIVRQAVRLSERYISDRFLPDKAIDLLDEACAAASLRNKAVDELIKANKHLADLKIREDELTQAENVNYEQLALVRADIARETETVNALSASAAAENSVTDDDLANVIELWTGIPASKIKESNLAKLSSLEDKIKAKIIGQDTAVEELCTAVRRSRVQISPRRRPASFIFVGPTGVGKTELVKVLANELFDSPETLIRLDMTEFMEKHSVSKLIGAPPGYVGYDEAGQLTEKVRRKPYSVLLFDEIEKAHPDVLNILLQLLDEGRLTDAQGRTVNFENTVIVMTSNAGSEQRGGSVGFGKSDEQLSREKAIKALEELLRPEFLGRVDEIIVFSPLSRDSLVKIAALMLDELKPVLEEKGIEFTYTEPVCAALADLAGGGKRGARDLRRFVRKEVEDKIATILVGSGENTVSAVTANVSDGKINVKSK